MDEAGIPMLVSISQYINGDQGSNNGNRSIHTTEVHNVGLNVRVNTNVDLKKLYIRTMIFSWNAISQQLMLY